MQIGHTYPGQYPGQIGHTHLGQCRRKLFPKERERPLRPGSWMQMLSVMRRQSMHLTLVYCEIILSQLSDASVSAAVLNTFRRLQRSRETNATHTRRTVVVWKCTANCASRLHDLDLENHNMPLGDLSFKSHARTLRGFLAFHVQKRKEG